MKLKLLELIRECEEYLDKESVDEVMHFYRHGEYEMALEELIEETNLFRWKKAETCVIIFMMGMEAQGF